uniref:Ty3 transposon capsid-like protein domain-containing protein n=1 Tax=Tanacetum cinerariifolium TaxID=118510 RepID=A0A6L2KZ66_TANCI|nr:hypothetical protein [Tanacetum cinerariifolium]
MSDSEDCTVTYTEVSSPFKDMSDIGSPRVVVYGYDGLLMHLPTPEYMLEPEHPPSPDYVPGPEHLLLPDYVPYVPEPAYPEFMPHADDVLPTEEQPLPAAVSPTADSPGYITESDLEEDSEDEDDEDLEEDPADYPTDRDDDDDEEEEDEDKDEEEEEEEEHLALANSVPPLAYHTTARLSIRAQTSIPLPFKTEVARLLPIPTPPPSPLTSYSLPLPASPTHPLGYRAAMIRLRAESPSTSHPLPLPPPIVLLHTRASMAMMRAAALSTYILAPRSERPPSGTPPLLPIPLPTSSPPLLLPSTDRRADVLEVTLLPRKRLCIAIGPRFKVGECSSTPTARPTGGFRADYGFVSTLDAKIRRDPDKEIDFVTTVRQDTDEIYRRLDDAHDDRLLMIGQFNSLCRDRRSYARTARLIESEARASREAWALEGQSELLVNAPTPTFLIVNHYLSKAPKELLVFRSGVKEWSLSFTSATAKYCPRNEIRKLERELWELKVKGTDLASYTQHFQELALLCGRMFTEEADKIEKYVGGLPDMIYGSVVASKPKTMQEAIEIATELMDKKVRTFAERETASKRKLENTSRTTRNQQQ